MTSHIHDSVVVETHTMMSIKEYGRDNNENNRPRRAVANQVNLTQILVNQIY